MADNTLIEWADATVNAVNGCSVVSPGCTNCYAMKWAGTRLRGHPSRAGLTDQTKAGPVWNGQVRLNEDQLLKPLRWKRPRRIFWNAHGDLFHDAVPYEWIDRVFAVCALTPHHQHLILTKRSERMRWYLSTGRSGEVWHATRGLGLPELQRVKRLDSHVRRQVLLPLPNVWLGVSVEDQARADQRIPDLLATPAAVRFISAEPLLGPVNIRHALIGQSAIDWVIVGGESGPGARPMHPDWARSLRDQCQAAGVPFFFKQWGSWAPVCEMVEELIETCYHQAPKHDPEAVRRCKVSQCVLHYDGQRFDGEAMFQPPAFWQGKRAMTMFNVGKKDAGRLLDGREWSEVPA